MARPDPHDIMLCVLCAVDADVLIGADAYKAAKRIVCNLVGQHYYYGMPTASNMSDALGRDGYTIWQEDSVAGNCATALAMFAERYPEG